MVKEVDAFFIHGISKEVDPSSYYTPLIEGIRKHLPVDFPLRIHPIDHSHLLKEKEETLFTWAKGFWYPITRRWANNYINDVIALSPNETMGSGNFYFDVLKMIEDKYDEAAKDRPHSKKVIFGHSLGAQIGLFFAFRRELDCLITAGGPMNYFAIRFPKFGRYPDATLHRMLCFSYRQDLVVNGPMGKNPNYNRPQVTDVILPLYNPWYWRPTKAHMRFFTDPRVHKITAANLLEVSGK